jgi:hypothetical protein
VTTDLGDGLSGTVVLEEKWPVMLALAYDAALRREDVVLAAHR